MFRDFLGRKEITKRQIMYKAVCGLLSVTYTVQTQTEEESMIFLFIDMISSGYASFYKK